MDAIAADTGVDPRVIRAKTAGLAPLSVERGPASEAEVNAWVALRRLGHSTARVASFFGVHRATVTTAIRPFPRPGSSAADVRRWVALRKARIGVNEIARAEGVPVDRVRRKTSPHGPFPYRRRDVGYINRDRLARH